MKGFYKKNDANATQNTEKFCVFKFVITDDDQLKLNQFLIIAES